MKNEDEFIERLVSVADNFKWSMMGPHLCGQRKDHIFDPITAYIFVSRGEFVPRHKVDDDGPRLAHMRVDLFRRIMKALYSTDYADPEVNALRHKIKGAVGM